MKTILLFLIVLASCTTKSKYKEMSPEEATKFIESTEQIRKADSADIDFRMRKEIEELKKPR